MCEFHWREFVPGLIRKLNKRAAREKNHSLTAYSVVLALSFAWSVLEFVGVPHPGLDHVDYPWKCPCPSCSSILRRAQKEAGIHDPGMWTHIVQRAGMFGERVAARAVREVAA